MTDKKDIAKIISQEDLLALLDSIDKNNPDPEAIARLHSVLDAIPELCVALGDKTSLLQQALVERIFSHPARRMALQKRAVIVRDELGYQGATQLEQLLIDHAVLCWLRLQHVESGYSSAMKHPLSLAEADFLDRHLAAAHRRYLRACESLARTRRLLHPTLQVNIAARGGQQVNVSGDVRIPPGHTSQTSPTSEVSETSKVCKAHTR